MSQSFPPPGYVPAPSAVPGIEVYLPAPKETAPQPEVVDFKCPQCGAVTAFSASRGGLTCAHCGYSEAAAAPVVGKRAEKFEFTVETLERSQQGWGTERKEMACQNCGAQVSLPPESLAHTCAFCGSNKVIQRQAPSDALRPRYLIPFKIEAQDCQKIVKVWLGSSWMTPASLRDAARLEQFAAVYLPYWTFHAITDAAWKAEVGHDKTERYYENGEWKERVVTEWRWESGRAQLIIDNLLVPGTARLSRLLLEKTAVFDLGDLVAYEPKYLAGLQAQAYDLPLEQAWEQGREQMREQTRQACLSQASTGKVRSFSMNLDFSDESWRYLLLPVYLNSYNYEGKTYQIMVNGQNGAIAGQRPVDWGKVWLVIAAVLSPGLLIGLCGLVTIPLGGIGAGIGIFGFVLLLIGIVVSIIFFTQANALDDA